MTTPVAGGGRRTTGVAPALAPTVHVITAGGMAGWQIALIALGAALVTAATTLLLSRAMAGHSRRLSTLPGSLPRCAESAIYGL